MKQDVREKAFDPYFTTKEFGKGTGIGLAVVHGIIEQHGGSIAAESQPGQGTTITILLPIVDGEPKDENDEQIFLPLGSEKILQLRPDIPTIICTGYSAKISEQEAANNGIRSFLMKPLNKAELAKSVRKVLDEAKKNEQ